MKKQLIKALLVTALVGLSGNAGAQIKDNPTLESEDSQYSVVAIKKKYFTKAKRHEIGLNVGVIPNDPYVVGLALGGSWGYHLSEFFFVEAQGAYVLNYKTDAANFLDNNLGVTPDLDDIDYYGEAHIGWAPIYGKFSFLTRKIFYFDISTYFGGGVTHAEISGYSPHATIGLAQRFVLNKSVALRFDIKDNIVFRDGAGVDSPIRNVIYIMMGLDFFAPLR